MKSKKFFVRASRALFAAIAFACLVAGCGDGKDASHAVPEKELPEVYPAENYGYMLDPEFKKVLAAQDAERNELLGEREKMYAELDQLIALKGSREAAEKSPEYAAINARGDAWGRAYESNRLHTISLMRERNERAMRDSERIRRGEAVAARAVAEVREISK